METPFSKRLLISRSREDVKALGAAACGPSFLTGEGAQPASRSRHVIQSNFFSIMKEWGGGIGFAGMAYTPGGNSGGSGRMLLYCWICPETSKSRLAGTLDVFKVKYSYTARCSVCQVKQVNI